MKDIMWKIFWIVVAIGILYGIYSILPEYPHNVVKSIFQPLINEEAKQKISQIQNLKDIDLDDTYINILESNCNSSAWVYDKNKETLEEKVTFYGTGAYLNLKDIPNNNGLLYTSANVKVEFLINDELVDIIVYVSDYNEPCNEVVEEEVLKQLKNGN